MSELTPTKERTLACPSAPISLPDARVFGVAIGSADAPEIAYLDAPLPITAEVLALAGELPPTEVFRVTARCAQSGCVHYQEKRCSLGDNVVKNLPVVAQALPPCSIRSHCRWFAENGVAACQRCPQLVTDVPVPTLSQPQRSVRKLKIAG